MLFTGEGCSFLSQTKLGDILVVETYFFWADFKLHLSTDTYRFILFSGSKKRCQDLVADAQSYLDWPDYKCESSLKKRRIGQQFVKTAFFPTEFIIEQFANINSARLITLQYKDLDDGPGFPGFVECFHAY